MREIETPFTLKQYVKHHNLELRHRGHWAKFLAQSLREEGYVPTTMRVRGKNIRVWVRAGETPASAKTRQAIKKIGGHSVNSGRLP